VPPAIFLGWSKELLGDDGTVGAAVADITLVDALSDVVVGASAVDGVVGGEA
jgi:hypothetical protein